MALYVILYFVTALNAISSYIKKRDNKIFLFFTLLFIGIFAGSRSEIGGSDYFVYRAMFDDVSAKLSEALSTKTILLSGVENGYIIIMSLSKQLGLEFNSFLLVLGILCSLGLYSVLNRSTNFIFLTLSIFLAKGFLYYFFTAQRQVIAMIICWIALRFLLEKKTVKFFSLVVLATLFHSSALVFGLVYFFYNITITNRNVVILSLISLIVGLLNVSSAAALLISQYLPFGAEKLVGYLEGQGDGINVLNFVEIIPVLLLVLLNRSRLENTTKHFTMFFNIYLVYVMLTFAFYDFAFIARLKGYFLIGYIIILASMIYTIPMRRIGIGFLVLLLLYCFAVFIRELLVFDNGEGYLPYKSYLF